MQRHQNPGLCPWPQHYLRSDPQFACSIRLSSSFYTVCVVQATIHRQHDRVQRLDGEASSHCACQRTGNAGVWTSSACGAATAVFVSPERVDSYGGYSNESRWSSVGHAEGCRLYVCMHVCMHTIHFIPSRRLIYSFRFASLQQIIL